MAGIVSNFVNPCTSLWAALPLPVPLSASLPPPQPLYSAPFLTSLSPFFKPSLPYAESVTMRCALPDQTTSTTTTTTTSTASTTVLSEPSLDELIARTGTSRSIGFTFREPMALPMSYPHLFNSSSSSDVPVVGCLQSSSASGHYLANLASQLQAVPQHNHLDFDLANTHPVPEMLNALLSLSETSF
ncbi:hypothetical protein Pelo_4918 [Pelomyxa schiedti]|nr:hypothetical protein Pelo_4918 [Pelomyxa schiedti]